MDFVVRESAWYNSTSISISLLSRPHVLGSKMKKCKKGALSSSSRRTKEERWACGYAERAGARDGEEDENPNKSNHYFCVSSGIGR